MTTTTQAARFAAAVYAPTDIVEVRMLPSRKSEWLLASELGAREWPKDQNVYVGANPRKKRGDRDAEGVALARCLFVDFDGVGLEEAAARISTAKLPEPTVIVASGGGVHCYWRLESACANFDAWSGKQRGLIGKLNSDKCIHDPPRIMRLPGTINAKRGRACELIECEAERVYPLSAFPDSIVAPETSHKPVSVAARVAWGEPENRITNPGGFEGLSRATLLFLHAGAAEGERNAKLFAAACDYAGCRISQAQAEHDLGAAATRCGLDDREALAAIRSAYGKGRTPSRPTIRASSESGEQPGADRGGSAPDPPNPLPDDDEQQAATTGRHALSNVTDAWREKVTRKADGKATASQEHFTQYKPIERIASEILHATGGWPKLLGAVPFVLRGQGLDAIPLHLPEQGAIFAWLHREMDVRWSSAGCEDPATGAARTPPTKDELTKYLKLGSGGIESYRMVTAYPHVPPMPGVYYPPLTLPAATGEALGEFLDHLNPATEDDRKLLLACLLTMFWGGEPGTRPMFVLTADSGMGAGKTSTAVALSDIAGGACLLDYQDNWTDLSKSMFSSDSWNSRVLLFDNVKGKYGGSSLEAAATAKTLSGWRAYVGQITRPNDATILVTFNQPSLTPDMARRSVIIKIGAPKHDQSFVAWSTEFIREHRLELIADIVAILRGKPRSVIPASKLDRWQRWTTEVLCRIDGAEALADQITRRRPEVDADAEDAIGLVEALMGATIGETITAFEIHAAAIKAGLWKNDNRSDSLNVQTCVAWARRVLSGRGIIEPKINESGKPARRKFTNDDGVKVCSAVFSLNRGAANAFIDDSGAELDLNLPI